MTEQELIERVAEKALISESRARYALSAIPIPLPVLLGLINGEMVAVPVEASPEMIEAGVDYRLNTSVHAGNGWPEDTSALFSAMIEARPK